jgi:hypothetical protein
LIFTDASAATLGIRSDVTTNFAIGGTDGINKVVDTAAGNILVNLVDADASWDGGVAPTPANNGINANVVTSLVNGVPVTHDGQSAWLDQIGTTNPPRETQGDGDYLDFSAWDAYKVVVNNVTVLEVTDTAGTGRYVNITGGTDGVYNFNIVDGASTKLIGVLDFGEAVEFDSTNFILFNDIIV